MEEIWKDIEGYEGLYQISDKGRVRSLVGWNGRKYIKRVKMLNPYKQGIGNNSDYYRSVVKLKNKGKSKDFKVHRLVAIAFLDNPDGKPNINHIDGNPLNNIMENLEWCTQKENIDHSIDSELKINRINTIDRNTMITFLNNGYTYDEIAEELDIAKGTVYNYIKKFEIKKIYQ